MATALVTDSNSQIPDSLRDRFGVRVVPIPVVVNGVAYLEGVDLDADAFYDLFAGGTPEVSTSQPSPGAFADVYQACIDDGADRIISVHVTEAMSGTLNSARLGASMVDGEVRLVDSRTISFGIACCVWQAGEILARGGSAGAAAAGAEALAGQLYSVTALGAAELAHKSGRVELAATADGVDIYRAGPDAEFDVVGTGASVDEVCELMAATMHDDGAPIRVALGIADQTAAPYYEGLETLLQDRDDVVDIVRYRIGPSVGAYTGLGTAGGFWFPAELS